MNPRQYDEIKTRISVAGPAAIRKIADADAEYARSFLEALTESVVRAAVAEERERSAKRALRGRVVGLALILGTLFGGLYLGARSDVLVSAAHSGPERKALANRLWADSSVLAHESYAYIEGVFRSDANAFIGCVEQAATERRPVSCTLNVPPPWGLSSPR